MKNAEFTVEFISHVLANGTGPEGDKGRFQRDGGDYIVFQQSWWYSAFCSAIELAHVRGIKAADVSMNLSFEAPTSVYNRRYGKDNYREHEAIMPGEKVKFEAVVADHVTTSTLTAILNKLGAYVGISPFGHRLGFGKFKVLEVNVADNEAE